MLRKLNAGRIIALGFAALILCGSFLLMLPVSIQKGVELRYIDALYTSVSAVCVTGLIAVDAGDTFTPIGQFILGLLIQTGGLGVTSVGVGVIIALRKKVDLKERHVLKESLNLSSSNGLVKFLKRVLLMTFCIELIGAVISFSVFSKDFPVHKAIGISLFHSVAAFNNSGFDILGDFQNLIPYQDDVLLNLVTCALIFLGGIGYLVIQDVLQNRFHFRKLCFHSKVVLTTSFVLIVAGTILLKVTDSISWLGALLTSVSARTAGFSTFPLGEFSNSGLLVVMILMFIGASPGSTGGGIKTSTFFVLLMGLRKASTNRSMSAFHYRITADTFYKATTVALLGFVVVCSGMFLLCFLEPKQEFQDLMFECVSAFGTVGLSTGITTELRDASKFVSILLMYIGRVGPLTIAALWSYSREERVMFPEGNISVG